MTLSTESDVKLLDQFKIGFKRTIDRNKYQSKASIQAENQYLDYLIETMFQGVNRNLFCYLRIMYTEQVTADIIFHL